jgi:hypothetical protein
VPRLLLVTTTQLQLLLVKVIGAQQVRGLLVVGHPGLLLLLLVYRLLYGQHLLLQFCLAGRCQWGIVPIGLH